jgi:hypothetical protein
MKLKLLFLTALAVVSFIAQAAGYDVAEFAAQHRSALMALALAGTITLGTGSQVAIASTYGASVDMTAISNAADAVATLAAAHGVVVGDYLEVTSGWDLLNNRIVRVSAVDVNDVTFEDIATTSTINYPAGTGTGSIRRITAWTNFAQVTNFEVSGGDPNFEDTTTLTDRVRKQMPIDRSPTQMSMTLFDDPLLSYFPIVEAAADAIAATGLRISYANGRVNVTNGYFTVGEPSASGKGTLKLDISFTAAAKACRFAS